MFLELKLFRNKTKFAADINTKIKGVLREREKDTKFILVPLTNREYSSPLVTNKRFSL